MNQDPEIKTIATSDLDALADLARGEYPSGEMADARFLEWEYMENPAGKALIATASDDTNRPIAQYVVIPVEVLIGNKLVKASLSLNTLTRTDYRGKGLFRKTAEATYRFCRQQGIGFTYGVPNKNSFAGFTQRLGFRHCGNLVLRAKLLRPFALAGILSGRREKKKGKDFEVSFDFEMLKRNSVTNFDPVADREMYAAFWSRWQNAHRIVLNKTIEYLNWRYFLNPIRNYYVFKFTENGIMTALLAFRMLTVYGLPAFVIMDLMCTEREHGNRLLHFALHGTTSGNPAIALAIGPNLKGETDQILAKTGFTRIPRWLLPQQLPFIVRIHEDSQLLESACDLHRWHFSFGDYDIF